MDLSALTKEPLLYAAALCMGFVAFKAYDFASVYEETHSVADSALEIVAYGVVNIVIALTYTGRILAQANLPIPFTDAMILIAALIGQPALFGLAFGFVQTQCRRRKLYFFPIRTTAWDWIFSRASDFVKDSTPDKPFVIVAKFANGETIAGTFERDAYASDIGGPGQLYLTRHIKVNGNGEFVRAASSESRGLVINCANAVAVELYPGTASALFR